jgi:hypothetical protein
MTHRGLWIVCRNCLFPIRLPSPLKRSLCLSGRNRLLLACPVCVHIEQYRNAELRAVAFRGIPDPFRKKKAALYAVEVPCGVARCKGMTKIYAVAATTLSVVSLLELWKHWVIHARCRNHSFKPGRRGIWGVYGVRLSHQRIV